MFAGKSTFSTTENWQVSPFLERCSKKKSFSEVLLNAASFFSSAHHIFAFDGKP